MPEKVSIVDRKIEKVLTEFLRNELLVSPCWFNSSVAFLATVHMSHILMH